VETLIHYPVPPHLSDAYRDAGWKKGAFPIAEKMADTVLTLPTDPNMSDEAIAHVIASIKSFKAGR
jgi:dTDP-4-amino-4,6-dideoxygalactose transaminase